jgi:hypothetical protein
MKTKKKIEERQKKMHPLAFATFNRLFVRLPHIKIQEPLNVFL